MDNLGWRWLSSQGSLLEEGRGGLAGIGGRRQGDSNAEAVRGGVGGAPESEKGEETDSSLNL